MLNHQQHTSLSKKLWSDPAYMLALGFGSGLVPFAPGTFGTLAAIPLYGLMVWLPWGYYAALVVAFFILGVFICGRVAHELKVADDSRIVWDEFVGYWVTMFLAPKGLIWFGVGFILFRVFDIIKPWPIRWVDSQVHGGWGIMLDDVVAAIPAWCGLHLIIGVFNR